jgi:hypothetical protein
MPTQDGRIVTVVQLVHSAGFYRADAAACELANDVFVYKLIAERARGLDTDAHERSVRGSLILISRTDPGFVKRTGRQLESAGITL